MASSLISNSVTNSTAVVDRSKRKKKKKSLAQARDQDQNDPAKWRTEKQQQIYSSKLIQALGQVRLSPPSPSVPRQGRSVREAADRALAVSAKGRTRWSRAILTNRLKLKFRKQQQHHQKRQQRVIAAASGSTRSKKPRVSVFRLKGKSLPAVQRKVKVLGRLVPGCRKQPLPVILEEATDYIAALEMQVRAMSALADLLSGSGSISSAASSSAPPPSQ
ncbi:transcription factor bHLH [Tripterygium wilfordii]|uniref:Transcription factor bHLH n=1 Tax=Tripterygium wilfordii TaxID=458696 RepID=A0A7J7CXJ1_TRIWF|nr:transcription factor bHLH147-like [Tripterygium wilfordii]XP_038721063.1 transcription factor bHLH147-like [Tripterygium wilfordii]KAF5738774.1 transcription factor bHLH [Tripterygium wilfordii]